MGQPLYAQLFETMLDRIATGDLAPGAMLPSESDLGREHGVSQGTARKALTMLEQEGVVERRQGRGTFVVARTPESSRFRFLRLRSLEGANDEPELVSETVRRRKSTAAERKLLDGAPEAVFEIERVRSLAGRNVLYERASVPAAHFPGLADRAPLPNALYVFYQHAYACGVARAEERLRAIAASEKVAEIFGLEVGAPVMEVERLAFDLRRRAVERRITICSTERHRYDISLA